jgi:CRISPR-associated protein Cas1
MIKRTLYFGNPAILKLKDKQLSIETVDEHGEVKTKTVAVEDIGVMVIDSPQITLTSGLIQALQENNVALITCDYRHMPQSLLLPLEGNSVCLVSNQSVLI